MICEQEVLIWIRHVAGSAGPSLFTGMGGKWQHDDGVEEVWKTRVSWDGICLIFVCRLSNCEL